MTDQPTPDALSRASAYLDGELDAAEAAAAETDPAMIDEVARLRALQDAIRDVGAPTSSARDTAIAAALAEFDRVRHPAPVVRSRPHAARWLAVAAAVVGLAALGTVIATNSRGSDGTASDATDAVAAAGSDTSLLSRSTAADEVPAPQQPGSAQSQAALAPGATGAPAASTYAAESGAAAQGAQATTNAGGGNAGGSAPFDPNTPIPDDVTLGRVGRQLLAQLAAGSLARKTGPVCAGSNPDVVVLSDAVLIVDGVARPVLIAGNPTNDDTLALDPDTCVIVATGQ